MIKEKTLLVDNFPFFKQKGQSIEKSVQSLNLIFVEPSGQTECQYINNQFIYKPLLWLKSIDLQNVKEINMIYVESKPTDLLKQKIYESFPNIKINFFHLFHFANYFFFELGQKLSLKNFTKTRTNNCFYSVATIRLPRYYLLQYMQTHNIDYFGCPFIEENMLKNFNEQIKNLSNSTEVIKNFKNEEKRPYGYIGQPEFEVKQMPLLADSYISIVTHYPWYDYVSYFYDEKISLPIAAKSLPFFFDNKDANKNLVDIGFEPYKGFDYSADSIDNFITRWKTNLDNNKKFLINNNDAKSIYDLNKDIIDKNYKILNETNWKAKALTEINSLPAKIKQSIFENTDFMEKSLL